MQNWVFKNAAAFSVIRKLLVLAQITITTVRGPYNQEAVAAAARAARTTPPRTVCTCAYKTDAQCASFMKTMNGHWDLF